FIKQANPSAVIALTEAAVGCAAKARQMLQLRGNSIATSIRCRNKYTMKVQAQAAGVPVTPFLPAEAALKSTDFWDQLGPHIVVKPVDQSGGRETVFLQDRTQVQQALRPGLLLEKFITGSEFSIESFVQQGAILFTNITTYVE